MQAKTHQSKVKLHESRLAKEAIIQRGHITPHNQRHDARVIQFVPPPCHGLAVVRQGVIRGAHAQAADGAAKEARQGELICARGRRVPRLHDGPAVKAGAYGDEGGDEVGPDVDGLVVQVEEGAEGVGVGGALVAVAGEDVVVVAAPGGEVVPEDEEGGGGGGGGGD
jgi:hypothetical protein